MFRFSTKPIIIHDIGLIKLSESVDDSFALQFCRSKPPKGSLLGACGLGFTTTNQKDRRRPGYLKEYLLKEITPCKKPDDQYCSCRPENDGGFRGKICTKDVNENSIESVCNGDSGGPMYEMGSNGKTPVCLYGVTSYAPSYDNTVCFDTAVFTDIFYEFDWITNTISQY